MRPLPALAVVAASVVLAACHSPPRRWLGLEDAGEKPSGAPASDDALEAARAKARIRAAVDALPERLREVIVLTEYAELSYAEIAVTLGIPAGTVGSRRNAALARLAEALGPMEET